MKIFLLVFFLTSQEILAEVTSPQVTTPLGTLEGRIRLSINNKPFFAFESVPYAEPPIGALRFEEPIPKQPWEWVRDAKNTTRCLQYDHFNQDENGQYLVDGEENCLFVNIYTPVLDPEANLDVLVHIHGGAFMFGAGENYGPDIVMDNDIVFVNLNYRLGALGFLSTEDDILPGNNGLRDQNLALKFVKENIKYFGGNPESITIWGLSAGGASVQLHYLMPQSKGLFKQGISQSGCVLNPWVLVENALEKTKLLADHLGCPTESSPALKNCLKSKPAHEIVESVKILQPWLYNPFSPLGVVVDVWAKDPVLPDHPYNLLKQGEIQDLPWIISHTTGEGLYPASDFYSDVRYLSDIDEKWNDIMSFVLHYNDSVDPTLRDDISRKIRDFYMKNLPVNRQTFSKLLEIISDRLFVADIETAARMHNLAVKSDVYSYVFDYRGAHSKTESRSKTNENIGVSHGDDTVYLASSNTETWTTEDDRRMIQFFRDMFTIFMRTGKPQITEDWLPLEKSSVANFLQLKISTPTEFNLEEKTEIGHRSFWNKLPFKENHHLVSENKDEL